MLTWDTCGKSSADSMPLGNGDIGLNVWTEPEGDLLFYISKTDAWSENVQLLKVGRVRVTIAPNPFGPGVSFSQTLRVADATIELRIGETVLSVWVDAHRPVIQVNVSAPEPVTVRARLEVWRVQDRALEGDEIMSAYGLDGSPNPVIVTADIVMSGQPDRIVWYHRNETSVWRDTLTLQGMANWAQRADDPLLGLTFGGAITGTDMLAVDGTTLMSQSPVRKGLISVHVLTQRTSVASAWVNTLMASIDRHIADDTIQTRSRHVAWWAAFWERSWIRISGAEDAETVTLGYKLQRFISACAGRGAYPIKFNGSLFTVEAFDLGYDVDFRRWGGPYWWQNTRLAYWPMLGSGDFDQMKPLFNLFADALPMAQERTRLYFGHGGAFFPETMYFWGSYANSNYGWDRTGKHPSVVDNDYIKREWTGMLELLALMIEYHAYTVDDSFAVGTLLPMADLLLCFFDEHFARDNGGQLNMTPAQSLETFWAVVNPTPDIAGLHWTLDRLLMLGPSLLGAQRQARWERLRRETPKLPFGQEGSIRFLLPATEIHCEPTNVENPELYAVFPFRLIGVGKPDLEAGRATYARRLFPGNDGWRQDETQAAFLGLTEEARKDLVGRFSAKHRGSRFPGFWGPNFDWIPDQDHGCNGLMALQSMLLQCDGSELRLFPAWPRDWEVEFRLNAPMKTVVEGVYRKGKAPDVDVSPEHRGGSVILNPDF